MFWKRRKMWTLIAALLLVFGGGGGYWAYKQNKPLSASAASTAQSTSVVKKGDIRQSVSGTSQFQAQSVQNITSPSSGTIKTMNLTRSLAVKKGDVLMEISNPTLDTNLQDAETSLNKLNRDLADLVDQQSHLRINAPLTGKLTLAGNIDVGSNVSVNTKIGTIADPSVLTVKLSFPLTEVMQLKKGDPVDLSVAGYLLTKTASVVALGTQPKVDASGNKLIDVELNVENDGSLDTGLQVSGSTRVNGIEVKSPATAALDYIRTVNVVAKASGTIADLNVKNGVTVKSGDLLVAIENKSLADNIADKRVEVTKQTVNVEDLKKKIADLTVVAPFDGVFSSDFADQKKNVLTSYPVGAKVEASVNFGAVASMSTMTLPIQVDELDLPSIKPGLKAEVRVDSLNSRMFEAEVASVSTVGVTTNGVTYYDAILTVKNTQDQLKYGMTATAEILIQDKKDALLVPIQALTTSRGSSTVTVELPDGTVEKNRTVKIGIRSKTQVEITEGLKEGDKVVLPVTQRQTNVTQQQIDQLRQQFQNGAGGGGFQPPAGGFQGGGGNAGGASGGAGGAGGGGGGGSTGRGG